MITLGNQYRDKLTGFVGTATGRAQYLNDVPACGITPRIGADGKLGETQWFAESRLEPVSDSSTAAPAVPESTHQDQAVAEPHSEASNDLCTAAGFCSGLAARVDRIGGGFHTLHSKTVFADAGNDAPRLLGVFYKDSNRQPATMMNWCPFCGGQPGDWGQVA